MIRVATLIPVWYDRGMEATRTTNMVEQLLGETYFNTQARADVDDARLMLNADGSVTFGAATALFAAALIEWGVGDERTSEATRLYILACDHDPRFNLGATARADLIRIHRLDDMCPIHLEDELNGRFPCCDEEDV